MTDMQLDLDGNEVPWKEAAKPKREPRKNWAAFGAEKEREVLEILWAEGWVVGRGAGSRGAADIVALRLGDRPKMIQVKGGGGGLFRGFPPRERIRLKREAQKAGADPVLCRWVQDERTWRMIGPEDWPPDVPVRDIVDFVVDENGCWLWQKALSGDGYGICAASRGGTLAHRIYYLERHGRIPDGLQLDHLCRVRHCVNPKHLEPVTQDENRLRGALTKLKPADVRAIRVSKESNSVLAERYGVGRSYVWRIRRGEARKDVAA